MNNAAFTDELKIIDGHGFVYRVDVEHHPELGISFAVYKGSRVARFEYGRWLLPRTDDDREWEEFEERFRGQIGGDALSQFEFSLKEYFDYQLTNVKKQTP